MAVGELNTMRLANEPAITRRISVHTWQQSFNQYSDNGSYRGDSANGVPFQSLTEPSPPAVANRLPCGLKATPKRASSVAVIVNNSSPVVVSQIMNSPRDALLLPALFLLRPTPPTDASLFSDALKSKDHTQPECPRRSYTVSQVVVSQTRILAKFAPASSKIPIAAASNVPSGFNADFRRPKSTHTFFSRCMQIPEFFDDYGL